MRAGAREWERVGHDDGALFRGARLAEAQRLVGPDRPRPRSSTRDFLDASLDRERRDRRAHRRGLAIVFGALAAGLIAVAVFAVLAIDQRREAERQRDAATPASSRSSRRRTSSTDPGAGAAAGADGARHGPDGRGRRGAPRSDR